MTAPVAAFLGTGEMNGAILAGYLAGGADPASVRATTRSGASAEKLRAAHAGISVFSGEESADANKQAVDGADVVLLGVKPGGIAALGREISPALGPKTLVVSVAAGVDLEAIEGSLPEGQPAVRAMPNLPTRVGRGVISLTPGRGAGPEGIERAKAVFGESGTVLEVPEESIGAVIGVSGSGPAYAFFLAEAMQKAGTALGLDSETARILAKETVAGAGELLHEPDAVPGDLKNMVCSPNGTTERAVAALSDGGLEALVESAARAAAERNAEMTEEFKK